MTLDEAEFARLPAHLQALFVKAPNPGRSEVVAMFPETTSGVKRGGRYARDDDKDGTSCFGDSGSTARFFYSAKASKADRAGSSHPTIKPVALMRWLARLVTPLGGTILDPFAGSGTTGQAALAEGFHAILIEREPEYQNDIRRRMSKIPSDLFA